MDLLKMCVYLPYTQVESTPTFLHISKNEKGKPSKMDLPLLKNDITNNLEPQKPVVYSSKSAIGSRYLRCSIFIPI